MTTNILFVCTDNFTRSIIAEFCMRDYLRRNKITSINVASAGIRASSDISKYSQVHFKIMEQMNIDTNEFMRTQFNEELFEQYDVIIGMSELHREYIMQEFNKEIPLFNEIYYGKSTPVNIGTPDSEGFEDQ
jgi:protein-tyrosine phosphatase